MEDKNTIVFAMRINIIVILVFLVYLILLIYKGNFENVYIPVFMSLLSILNISICKNKLKKIKK